jgi:hypothetical protein
MGGFGVHDVRRRRRSIRDSLLQQRRGRRGGRAEASDQARHDVGVFPP